MSCTKLSASVASWMVMDFGNRSPLSLPRLRPATVIAYSALMLTLPVPASIISHVHHVQQACPARLRSEGICSTSQPCALQLRAAASAEAAAVPRLRGLGEIVAVESLDGVRVQLGDTQQPIVEYLVNWKVSGA